MNKYDVSERLMFQSIRDAALYTSISAPDTYSEDELYDTMKGINIQQPAPDIKRTVMFDITLKTCHENYGGLSNTEVIAIAKFLSEKGYESAWIPDYRIQMFIKGFIKRYKDFSTKTCDTPFNDTVKGGKESIVTDADNLYIKYVTDGSAKSFSECLEEAKNMFLLNLSRHIVTQQKTIPKIEM